MGQVVLVATSQSLLRVDWRDGSVRVLHRGEGVYYGLAAAGGQLAVAARGRLVSAPAPRAGERGAVLILEGCTRQLLACLQPAFGLRDVHELAWVQGTLWVTCTLDDWVAIRAPDGGWRRWWPLPVRGGGGWDRVHFNSLLFEGELVWVLAHRQGPSWLLAFPAAAAGRGETVPPLRQLELGVQAHNLWRLDGALWTCSSAEGRLVSETGAVVVTGGFPRGVARLTQDGATTGWVVGVSGLLERAERDWASATLVIFDAQWREQRRLALPGEGLVMDVLAVDEDMVPLNPRDAV